MGQEVRGRPLAEARIEEGEEEGEGRRHGDGNRPERGQGGWCEYQSEDDCEDSVGRADVL